MNRHFCRLLLVLTDGNVGTNALAVDLDPLLESDLILGIPLRCPLVVGIAADQLVGLLIIEEKSEPLPDDVVRRSVYVACFFQKFRSLFPHVS